MPDSTEYGGSNMEQIINRLAVKGIPVTSCRFGEGHINETYLVTCDTGLSYILQKINRQVFQNPEGLMENIVRVTAFLEHRTTDRRMSMHLVPASDGCMYTVDEKGEYWRVYEFVTDSICLQRAEKPQDLYHVGLAFGNFQQLLADFPAGVLHESIRDFHNTKVRYMQFHEALERDIMGRAESCVKEIRFALAHESEAGMIVDGLADGTLPLRVTHNDTKLNNILLDYTTRKPLCVIDLDTVMPGSALYDYGDSVRFGVSTALEDEKDLTKVHVDMDLYQVFTKGYLDGCGGSLTEAETVLLPVGAKLMTLECGVRFLTDHLNGDRYFRISRESHNLDRCRTQFKLVQEMEDRWEEITRMIREMS